MQSYACYAMFAMLGRATLAMLGYAMVCPACGPGVLCLRCVLSYACHAMIDLIAVISMVARLCFACYAELAMQ